MPGDWPRLPLTAPPARPAPQSQGRGNDVKPANLSLFGGSSSSASKPSSSTPKYQPPVRSTGSNIASSKVSSTYGSSSSAMTGSGKAVRVTFALQQELPFGQSLKLVGSHPALGGWKEDMGLVMQWTEGHRWSAAVSLPAGTALEFKVRPRALRWAGRRVSAWWNTRAGSTGRG